MPTKPKKVQGAGVGVYADGATLSRLQSVTADTDLGIEEIRELTNSSVVEFVEGLPTVTVQMEANQIGSRKNLANLTGQDGDTIKGMTTVRTDVLGGFAPITHLSFDGTSCDLVIQVEEDSVLSRSMYIPASFMTSVSWNFDVGGVATESYALESDDKIQFLNDRREFFIVSGYYDTSDTDTGTSGYLVTPHPDVIEDAGDYFFTSGMNDNAGANDKWTPIFFTLDGSQIVDPTDGSRPPITIPGATVAENWVRMDTQYASLITAGRVRIGAYRDTPNTTISAPGTDSQAFGGLRKGMIEIFLVSGETAFADLTVDINPKILRLQTCSVDVDLSREALEELSNSKAFERSLNFPISATVNFSALASDIELWAGLADQYEGYLAGGSDYVETAVRDFVQTAGVVVKIYNDDDTNPGRAHLMTFAANNLRVASDSFSVDAGGNAVQEFSCNTDNFAIS
jgi:hypothetical protein